MRPTPEQHERVHALWDALADYTPSQREQSLDHLLRELCVLLNASNAGWVASVRFPHAREDPLSGWRVSAFHYIRSLPRMTEALKRYREGFDKLQPDVIAINFHAMAGRFRVCRMRDLVRPGWYSSDYYRWFFREGMDSADGLRIGIPVGPEVEAGFAIHRDATRPAFTRRDCEFATYVLRGLRWFQRQQLIGQGLLLAAEPLTASERRALGLLLEGKSNKDIATTLKQSPYTVNEYARRVYRKFGVVGRAELLALWLRQVR